MSNAAQRRAERSTKDNLATYPVVIWNEVLDVDGLGLAGCLTRIGIVYLGRQKHLDIFTRSERL